jgi:hypothetical protein
LSFDWEAAAGSSALTAGVAGFFAWLAARAQKRRAPDQVGDTIASAFKTLVDELQEENRRHLKMINGLRDESQRLRKQLQKLRAFADALFRHIAALEALIQARGEAAPERPSLPAID